MQGTSVCKTGRRGLNRRWGDGSDAQRLRSTQRRHRQVEDVRAWANQGDLARPGPRPQLAFDCAPGRIGDRQSDVVKRCPVAGDAPDVLQGDLARSGTRPWPAGRADDRSDPVPDAKVRDVAPHLIERCWPRGCRNRPQVTWIILKRRLSCTGRHSCRPCLCPNRQVGRQGPDHPSTLCATRSAPWGIGCAGRCGRR